jgi:hypothetical protein
MLAGRHCEKQLASAEQVVAEKAPREEGASRRLLLSELKSPCGNLDFHSLYLLENRASRVAPTKPEIEKDVEIDFCPLPHGL